MGMCQSTVSKVTTNVLKEMESKLCSQHIVFNPQNSANCKEWFMAKYNIPGVIGCIDGTHIGMRRPSANEHMFFNRKDFHSLNAMIICDHKNRILAINCKYGGAAHDSFVWKQSNERKFLEEQFRAYGSENAWLLGDSGYPIEPWCVRPYRNTVTGSNECLFNEIHSKARNVIERTIGILKERWKMLQYNQRGRYSPEKIASFANVCAALNNICIDFEIPFSYQASPVNTTPEDISIE